MYTLSDRTVKAIVCPNCGSLVLMPKHGHSNQCKCGYYLKVLGNTVELVNKNKPNIKIFSIKVSAFKPDGKFYSGEMISISATDYVSAVIALKDIISSTREIPGLVKGALDYHVLLTCEDNYPHLFPIGTFV